VNGKSLRPEVWESLSVDDEVVFGKQVQSVPACHVYINDIYFGYAFMHVIGENKLNPSSSEDIPGLNE
jgi:hypothetical protein